MRKLLLSIKPKFVKQILLGTKKVEYRKKIHLDRSVTRVVVYESSPTKRVVAEFEIKKIMKSNPIQLWNETHEEGGISKDEFFSYFKGHDIAYAYQIGEIKKYMF